MPARKTISSTDNTSLIHDFSDEAMDRHHERFRITPEMVCIMVTVVQPSVNPNTCSFPTTKTKVLLKLLLNVSTNYTRIISGSFFADNLKLHNHICQTKIDALCPYWFTNKILQNHKLNPLNG